MYTQARALLPAPVPTLCALCMLCLFWMQLGSQTLGRVNDEDAEKGLVYWDVFKSARLEALKPRTLDQGVCKGGCGGVGGVYQAAVVVIVGCGRWLLHDGRLP